MTTTWTRKWLDGDGRNSSQQGFIIYNGQLVFYDPGPLVSDGQAIATSDGETFASILDVDSAMAGIGGQTDQAGASMAVYRSNLFISQATGPALNDAKALEWDGVAITKHLNSVLSQANLWSYSLLSWANRLWLITDQSSGLGNHRRVVYYFDGSSWTAIIDYDGAAYLNYNKAAGLPGTDIRHRSSKLVIYANRLYLLATRWNSVSGQWNWQSWILNNNLTEFNKLADIDAGYIFSGASSFEGIVYVLSNTISAGGVPQNPAKIYSTTDMANFSLEGTIADLGFPFGEAVFNKKFFINVLDLGTGNTEVKYYDRFAGTFTTDATITTNTSANQSGDLIAFKGGLYGGKWKEVNKRESVSGLPPPGRKKVIAIKTRWKTPAGVTAFRNYAPEDTRAPTVFYDGRILGISGISRSIDDKTGMFSIGDITIDLANDDKEFSKLLNTHIIKNQMIEVYSGWEGQAHGDLILTTRMIVEDHPLSGPVFRLLCKDASQAYFKKKVPFYLLSDDEFPNIHPDALGLPAPDLLGLNSITTGESPGATEAVYIDTTIFRYLAAYGTLDSIPEVYSSNTLQTTPGDYSITYADGYTYIDFVRNQGDNKITFNSTGYSVPGWNSDNGYIQNPAYILLYFLNQIMEVPAVWINYESFDELAALYITLGDEESGKLPLDYLRGPDEVLRELLFSFEATLFPDNSGRFTVKRKDIKNFSTSKRIFAQIHLLEPAERTFGLREAVNYAKIKWDFHSAPNVWKGAKEVSRAVSINDLETKMEPQTDWNFPWMISESFIDSMVQHKLLKFGYGDKKLSFKLPIDWLERLDIFDNFRYQDPYGLSTTGAGETGRYYYIESLNYNLLGNEIDVVAIDLQWLLRQYLIMGDENSLATNWSAASEADKLYGYLCDETTSKFANSETGKIMIDEKLLE